MSQNLQSVADLSAFVVMADGREDPSEWEVLKTLAENQGFEWAEFSQAVHESIKEQVEADSTEEAEAILHSAGYGLNPEKVDILFGDFIDIILSNDEIDLGEISILVKIREILRISEVYFVMILAMKMTEQAQNGAIQVTFNDLKKSPEKILEEIRQENKEELEEVA
jgi:uncharacterized tellurite resistance protein B-like protein